MNRLVGTGRNIAVKLSYLGTKYHGWQRQENAVSVQQRVEEALSQVLKCDTRVVGCGRTDAGVHARNYCLNFKTDAKIPAARLPYAMNSHLAGDIAVSSACEVEDEFNAILSCKKKEYTYLIHNAEVRDPFLENRVWFYPQKLDARRMGIAAKGFIGTHDFNSVRSVGTEVKSTVRTIYYIDVFQNGDIIGIRMCADGFLYNMARAITGTLVYASIGKIKPESVPELLVRGDRNFAGPTAPPQGLYMTALWYDGVAGSMFSTGKNDCAVLI